MTTPREIIKEEMEVFYQRDRSNTDYIFKEILKKQNEHCGKIDKIEKLLEKVVKILDRLI